MSLWITFAIMSLVALGFAIWPLYRQEKRMTGLIAAAIIGIVGLSAGLYYFEGQPEVPSGAASSPEMDDVIASLAERLEENPEDLTGWKMLGRSYMTLGNFVGASEAFERAIELESGRDAQTLVALGEAKLAGSGGSTIAGDVSALFESALAIDPNNPQALFYGGIGAFNRDDQALAANRWERLLSLNPPAEIEGILRQRIAEWRDEDVVVPESSPPLERPGVLVSAMLSLSEAAAASLPGDASVFIIARDPAQPSPPIAVTRRRLSELPVRVDFSDGDSMVPGRSLSGFAEIELVARVSMSGQPTQQTGDWFGAVLIRPAESNTVEISISEQVP